MLSTWNHCISVVCGLVDSGIEGFCSRIAGDDPLPRTILREVVYSNRVSGWLARVLIGGCGARCVLALLDVFGSTHFEVLQRLYPTIIHRIRRTVRNIPGTALIRAFEECLYPIFSLLFAAVLQRCLPYEKWFEVVGRSLSLVHFRVHAVDAACPPLLRTFAVWPAPGVLQFTEVCALQRNATLVDFVLLEMHPALCRMVASAVTIALKAVLRKQYHIRRLELSVIFWHDLGWAACVLGTTPLVRIYHALNIPALNVVPMLLLAQAVGSQHIAVVLFGTFFAKFAHRCGFLLGPRTTYGTALPLAIMAFATMKVLVRPPDWEAYIDDVETPSGANFICEESVCAEDGYVRLLKTLLNVKI